MPIDYSHEHFASSIIQNANPHTPIDPTGGGVSVDNGTDPPAAVTTLNVAGADVSVPDQATLSLPLLRNVIQFSSADILALNATPKELVAGVADFVIVPSDIITMYAKGTTDYTEAGQYRLFTGVSWAASSFGSPLLTGNWVTEGDRITITDPASVYQDHGAALDAATVGQPVRLDASDAVADGDGTMAVTISYYLIPVP